MYRFTHTVQTTKRVILPVIALLFMYYTAFNNFELFHVITELLSIVIGFSIYIITKNTHKVSQNNYFIFLGICFLLSSSFEFIHLITYMGIDVVKVAATDAATQFRLIAMYIQASSIFIFCLLIYRQDKPVKLLNLLHIYYCFSLVMFLLVAYWGVFPKIYIDGVGITTFTLISEVIICLVLFSAIMLLIKSKKKLHENISLFLLFAIGVLVLSEICFMLQANNDGTISIASHALKLFSYYLIYKAIIQTTLENPYNILFYRLTEINSSLEIKTRLMMKINEKLNEEIAERKAVEEKLRDSKKKYQELLDFLPYAIMTHSNGKIVYVNNAALNLVNLDNYKDVLNRDTLDFIHPDNRELFNEIAISAYNNKSSNLIELKILTSDGKEIYAETKAVPYTYKDSPAALFVIGDITERKKAEEKDKALKEAMEYDRIKNEFMANISHELRTPLNVIFGAVQLIEYYSENNSIFENKQNITKYSKSMRQNCYRMLRLVNNLIDLTRLDSGFFKLNLQNHNIISIVEDITLSVAQYIESKDINIEFDTEVEERYLACDVDMIERIILNILSNAVKFTSPGGNIWVNIYDRGDFMLISIKDSGIGIPEDKLNIIFDRFRQVDKSLARNTEGSGIGLNLVKSLVELHGGEICAESQYGQGSEFIIELPSRTVPWDEVAATTDIPQGKVERIHIEFSDIYC